MADWTFYFHSLLNPHSNENKNFLKLCFKITYIQWNAQILRVCFVVCVLLFFKAYAHNMEERTTEPFGSWNADLLPDRRKINLKLARRKAIQFIQQWLKTVLELVAAGSVRGGVNLVLKPRWLVKSFRYRLRSTKPANRPSPSLQKPRTLFPRLD